MDDTLTKADVVAWLNARARAYESDSVKLAALVANGDGDGLEDMPEAYLAAAVALYRLAGQFRDHGPLPPLTGKWAAAPVSGAGRCLSWPDGCGERTRFEGEPRKSPAVLIHRDGCPVAAAEARIRAEGS